MKSANIFDAVETNLDQRIFDGIEPRRTVTKFIKRVYYHALDRRLGVIGTEWADLYFTGSLTTYQYSPTSDADVSVFPNYNLIWSTLNIDPHEARKRLVDMSINYLDGTFLPGTQHPLQFFVVPPGVSPGDLYQPGLRSGYDVLHGGWLTPPERSRSHNVQMEMPDAFQRAADIAEKITLMLDAGDYDSAKEVWHNVHAKRQLDQRAGLGDYSEGNIVYKWLLHEGLFDRIRSELNEYIAKTGTWNGNVDVLWRMFDANYLNTPHRSREESRARSLEFAGYVGLSPEEANQQFDAWMQDRETKDQQNKQRAEENQRQQEQWRLEGDEERQKMMAEYEDKSYEILHRFDALEPPDAPKFEGDRIDMVDYAVTQGWMWKYIISRGDGAWVWADSETHDYGGIAPHSEMMVELKNSGEMPKPDPQNMSLGWIEKPPLEEGDLPYEVIVRGGSGFSDDEIRQYLTLTPADTVNRDGGPMVLRWFGKTADVNERMRDREDEHYDALAYIWASGKTYFSRWGHKDIFKDNPGLFDIIKGLDRAHDDPESPYLDYETIPSVYYAGRVFDDGEVVNWTLPEPTPQIEEQIFSDALEFMKHKSSAVDHLWDDRITTKIIYDFDKDRIILGTQADLPKLHEANKIIGEYVDGRATLFEADKQWINPSYFRRLWHVSYPERELKDVYFRRETGDEYKLKDMPRKRKKNAAEIQPGGYQEDVYKFVWIPKLDTVRVWTDGEYSPSEANGSIVPHARMIRELMNLQPSPSEPFGEPYKKVVPMIQAGDVIPGMIYYNMNQEGEDLDGRITVGIYGGDWYSDKTTEHGFNKQELLNKLQLPADTIVFDEASGERL